MIIAFEQDTKSRVLLLIGSLENAYRQRKRIVRCLATGSINEISTTTHLNSKVVAFDPADATLDNA